MDLELKAGALREDLKAAEPKRREDDIVNIENQMKDSKRW